MRDQKWSFIRPWQVNIHKNHKNLFTKFVHCLKRFSTSMKARSFLPTSKHVNQYSYFLEAQLCTYDDFQINNYVYYYNFLWYYNHINNSAVIFMSLWILEGTCPAVQTNFHGNYILFHHVIIHILIISVLLSNLW